MEREYISTPLEQRIDILKSKIPHDILRILKTLYENKVYIGTHGGGITHELGPASDIDLAVIPPNFNPDLLAEFLSQIYTNGRQPPIPLEKLKQLIQTYAEKIDYISLKVLQPGNNPLSLHIENPNFRLKYATRKVAREFRVPPKNEGVNTYPDIGIDPKQNLVKLRIIGGQKLLQEGKVAINFLHTTQIIDPNQPPADFGIETINPNTHFFILGLEANKSVSETNLFSPYTPQTISIIPLITSFKQLAAFLGTTPHQAGILYTNAYSTLLFQRKGVTYPYDKLIQTLPALRAALEYAESL